VRWFARLVPLAACMPLAHAAVCNPAAFQGTYGFQLYGATTISGNSQPAVVVGRLVFDQSSTVVGVSSSGMVSGISSVKFTGLLLGNPVTGTYEAKVDCSLSWSLQDDSGNSQHFQGTMNADGTRIAFRQSDPGGIPNGTMIRTAKSCTAGDFEGRFALSFSGDRIDVDTNRKIGSISQGGLIEVDGQGGLSYAANPSAPFQSAGTYEMEDDCIIQFGLDLPADSGNTAHWQFRAVLVGGNGIGPPAVYGIESDPGTVATVRLTAGK
jgi:hypothetical protein